MVLLTEHPADASTQESGDYPGSSTGDGLDRHVVYANLSEPVGETRPGKSVVFRPEPCSEEAEYGNEQDEPQGYADTVDSAVISGHTTSSPPSDEERNEYDC